MGFHILCWITMPPVRIYLAPGMFGFARLAAYDYFEHLSNALAKRFRAKGRRPEIRVVEVHPTSSIRRRAAKLAQMLAHTAGTDDGPIHILGHSTGGLDARLVASPTSQITQGGRPQGGWLERLKSITTVNTPHYGTPLASFFATAKGQQLLYAVSAVTVTALKLGAPPLATASALVAALGRTGDSVGFELALVDKITDTVTRALDEASSRSLHDWLQQVRGDQGGVVQLMPEAMDLFHAGVEDRASVRYQCVASYAPPGGLGDWLHNLRSPWTAVSAALFHLMYRVTAEQDERYPCAPPEGIDALLRDMLGEIPDRGASDGVVPLSSQIWGHPLWIGKGDHLDIVGHFPGPGGHNDWLASGARFDIVRFDRVMDRIFDGMIEAEG
jgi:triacylglycerol lipase